MGVPLPRTNNTLYLSLGSVVELMMLRSAVNYNVKTESWSFSTKSCINQPGPSGTGPAPSSCSKEGGLPTYSKGTTPLSEGRTDQNNDNKVTSTTSESPVDLTSTQGHRSNTQGQSSSFGENGYNLGNMASYPSRPYNQDVKKIVSNAVMTTGSDVVAGNENLGVKSSSVKPESTNVTAAFLKNGSPETIALFKSYGIFIKSLMKVRKPFTQRK